MNTPTNTITDSSHFINDVYNKLGYFDMYGGAVIFFITITVLLFFVVSYCQIMQTKEDIASDWVNQRCKAQNIPFAGYISKPDDKTAFEYTQENFEYCMQNVLVDVTSTALQPLQFLLSGITSIFTEFGDALQQSRDLVNKLRDNIKVFAQDVLQRILNVVIPVQKIFIALIDSFNKMQGVMTAGLYTMLGSYYTLQTLMGSILEMMIKMLVVLVIVIVGLWALPFTWPAAATTSLIFIGIATPLAVIVAFMTEVLHIQSAGIPKLRCYDENTIFKLKSNHFKLIKNLQVGDILEHNERITAIIKVTSLELDMYYIRGIIVSGNHLVKFNDEFLPVSHHPEARIIQTYDKPYLYCLNTDTKTITNNGLIFSDWDEICEPVIMQRIMRKLSAYNLSASMTTADIHRYLDGGFAEDTVVLKANDAININKVSIGDILKDGSVVYGIVHVDTNNLILYDNNNLGNPPAKLFHLLTTTGKITLDKATVGDYNHYIDDLLA